MKNWIQLAAALAADAPHLLGSFITLINDVAHGKGGAAKALNVVKDVEALAPEVIGIAASSAIAPAPVAAAEQPAT